MNIKHDENVNFAAFQQLYLFAKIEDRVFDFWVCKSFGLKSSSQAPDPKGQFLGNVKRISCRT